MKLHRVNTPRGLTDCLSSVVVDTIHRLDLRIQADPSATLVVQPMVYWQSGEDLTQLRHRPIVPVNHTTGVLYQARLDFWTHRQTTNIAVVRAILVVPQIWIPNEYQAKAALQLAQAYRTPGALEHFPALRYGFEVIGDSAVPNELPAILNGILTRHDGCPKNPLPHCGTSSIRALRGYVDQDYFPLVPRFSQDWSD